ncbi:hypothetical protein JCM19302_709 [Jejuia pallidilutea]|uniref:Uncharacterized protein n=1 Tax=Jejuia pallidilutea TaxID=504487 RepID=A0A090W2W4_9FLAO|nr:hypothetical protein JCM19302_709 [Jejuia pallidilutea]
MFQLREGKLLLGNRLLNRLWLAGSFSLRGRAFGSRSLLR